MGSFEGRQSLSSHGLHGGAGTHPVPEHTAGAWQVQSGHVGSQFGLKIPIGVAESLPENVKPRLFVN